MCNIVTILIKYYMKEENNNFQCQLSRIYFYMEKNPHLRDSPTLPYQLMFEIISWENKLDNIFSLLQHSIMIDIRAVTHVLITNSVCIMHVIIGLTIE